MAQMVLDQEDLKQIDNFGLRLLASNLPLWNAELERMRWSSPGGKFCNPLTFAALPSSLSSESDLPNGCTTKGKVNFSSWKSGGVLVQKILKSGCERTDQVMFSKRMPQNWQISMKSTTNLLSANQINEFTAAEVRMTWATWWCFGVPKTLLPFPPTRMTCKNLPWNTSRS